jgi:hypothetical protein
MAAPHLAMNKYQTFSVFYSNWLFPLQNTVEFPPDGGSVSYADTLNIYHDVRMKHKFLSNY